MADATPPAEKKKKEYSLIAQCAAEAFGTFCIVAGGCGAVAASKFAPASKITNPAVAAAFGASVMIGAFSSREVSGAHLNPAITAACVLTDLPEPCGIGRGAAFVVAQFVGATAAAAVNFGLYKNAIRSQERAAATAAERAAVWGGAFGVMHDAKVLSRRGLFLTELGTTAMLLFAINCIGDDDLDFPSDAAGPALVGSTVGLLIMATGTISGTGMNPARDLGPRLITALASGPKVALGPTPPWIYTFGPLAGALTGCAAYKAFKGLLDADA